MTIKTMPPLGAGSVDAAALEKNLTKMDGAEAVAKATTLKPLTPAPRDAAETSPIEEATVVLEKDGYSWSRKSGGWNEIAGPDLDKPFKTQDEDKAAARFEELTGVPVEPAADETD